MVKSVKRSKWQKNKYLTYTSVKNPKWKKAFFLTTSTIVKAPHEKTISYLHKCEKAPGEKNGFKTPPHKCEKTPGEKTGFYPHSPPL